ncbi:hypothetical protein [Aestuariivita boseongensis]|uniref:hypothetical protein n=1 Tax=Aestuariivita boseongensis TaxID=1470562 RepID=UPI0006827F4E|nr:hypothetical protein [Aestuariivita boseongensis]
MSDRPSSNGPGLAAIALRIALLLGAVVAGTWIAHALKEALDLQIIPANEQQVHAMLMVGLVAYVVLLAMPFVPGAEIGLAMLTAFGAAIVPLVYGATVVAMLLAYLIGSLLPVAVLARLLTFFRLRRAADLVARAAPLQREERLDLLLESAPPRAVSLGLRHRYVALALAINVPGNSVVGGGGGIMMMAGLSGLFAPLQTFLAIAIGVSPIPLVILLLGA